MSYQGNKILKAVTLLAITAFVIFNLVYLETVAWTSFQSVNSSIFEKFIFLAQSIVPILSLFFVKKINYLNWLIINLVFCFIILGLTGVYANLFSCEFIHCTTWSF
ncbi:hypothetical protein IPJ72_03460 [Candidatus Peregrinibacteria bacterium]|nr:MAG: hypothetical protein IPJ72_03460 [Candidatus Peregrinibacteria bacterium]